MAACPRRPARTERLWFAAVFGSGIVGRPYGRLRGSGRSRVGSYRSWWREKLPFKEPVWYQGLLRRPAGDTPKALVRSLPAVRKGEATRPGYSPRRVSLPKQFLRSCGVLELRLHCQCNSTKRGELDISSRLLHPRDLLPDGIGIAWAGGELSQTHPSIGKALILLCFAIEGQIGRRGSGDTGASFWPWAISLSRNSKS